MDFLDFLNHHCQPCAWGIEILYEDLHLTQIRLRPAKLRQFFIALHMIDFFVYETKPEKPRTTSDIRHETLFFRCSSLLRWNLISSVSEGCMVFSGCVPFRWLHWDISRRRGQLTLEQILLAAPRG